MPTRVARISLLLFLCSLESLRYRAEDVVKSVTKIAVRESRAQDLRNEILNSEKLKAHFESNPRDLDLLKHDKELSKKLPPAHLRAVPEYLQNQQHRKQARLLRWLELQWVKRPQIVDQLPRENQEVEIQGSLCCGI